MLDCSLFEICAVLNISEQYCKERIRKEHETSESSYFKSDRMSLGKNGEHGSKAQRKKIIIPHPHHHPVGTAVNILVENLQLSCSLYLDPSPKGTSV